MDLTKERIVGFTGSLIFCAIMFLILWLAVLKTAGQPREGGILVNFGNVNEASGTFEPRNMGVDNNVTPIEPVVPEIPVQAPSELQPAITQDNEQTVSIDAENKRKEEEQRRQEQLRKEYEEQIRREEELRRQQAINNQVAGAFGAGNTQSTGQGAGTGQGNQGSPQGNSDSGADTGVGRWGDFSLEGRKLGPEGLPRPAFTVQEEGVVVVDITVDRNGNVISAIIGRGTTTGNTTLRQSALEAARKAKFNAIPGNENQSGKITYRFRLN